MRFRLYYIYGAHEDYPGHFEIMSGVEFDAHTGVYLDAAMEYHQLAYLKPGHYVLYRVSDKPNSFGGVLFTVSDDGLLTAWCDDTTSSNRVTHWPPKS